MKKKRSPILSNACLNDNVSFELADVYKKRGLVNAMPTYE
jgi:hypothetical protein